MLPSNRILQHLYHVRNYKNYSYLILDLLQKKTMMNSLCKISTNILLVPLLEVNYNVKDLEINLYSMNPFLSLFSILCFSWIIFITLRGSGLTLLHSKPIMSSRGQWRRPKEQTHTPRFCWIPLTHGDGEGDTGFNLLQELKEEQAVVMPTASSRRRIRMHLELARI
jgi:hypothetical protein